MVSIVYSDENLCLTDDMRSLFMQAAEEALSRELGDGLAAIGLSMESADTEIGVTVTGDDEIRDLNREYRGIDKVTDVLSFPQYESCDELLKDLADYEEGSTVLIGDVVICHDRALRQAEEYGTGAVRELTYLFVHSVLHLLGYDHIDEEERRIMRMREESVLDAIGDVILSG